MIVDGEKLVGDYLREEPALSALIGRRVVGKPPASTDEPWVKQVLLSAPQAPGSQADHLIEHYFQFDCYAGNDGGQPEALLVGRTLREALQEGPGAHDLGVWTATRIEGFGRIPDPVLKDRSGDARERVIVTASVWMHP